MKIYSYCAVIILVLSGIYACKNNDKKNYTEGFGKEGKVTFRIQDDTLTAFMMGGVYFFQGYGGVEKTYNLIRLEMNKKPGEDGFVENLHKVYNKMMIYPYHRSPKDKIDAKQKLEEWWQVHNAGELHALMEQLQNKGHEDIYQQCKKIIDENGGASAVVANIDLAKYKINPDAVVLLQFIKDNYKQLKPSGIKSWDLARLVSVVCLAYSAEYIDAADGIAHLLSALKDARKDYKDWNAFNYDFIMGRKFWGGDTASNPAFSKMMDDMQKGDYSIMPYLPLK